MHLDEYTRPSRVRIAMLTLALLALPFPERTIAQTKTSGEARLSLDGYLRQVRDSHSGLKASLAASTAASNRTREAELVTSPFIFANSQLISDETPPLNPAFQGDKTVLQNYSLGVGQQTPFGLQARLSYNLAYTSLHGVNPTYITEPSFYIGKPTLELQQSLWRNFLGSETRATRDLLESQSHAADYSERFRTKTMLAEAEGNYWRLALSREIVAIQKDNLQRTKKIREWNARRVSLNLADQSDLLQAEALLQLRQLDLERALDQERAAARSFNSLRGNETDQVADALNLPTPAETAQLAAPQRNALREDVQAAQEAMRTAKASAKLLAEKYRPKLDLLAGLSLNGRDASFGGTTGKLAATDHPTMSAGLQFSVALNFPALKKMSQSAEKETEAATLRYDRKVFEEELEWKELLKRLDETKRQLELAATIEKAQSKKAERERQRLHTGRTTTFQALMFEQDYGAAQLLRVQAEGEALQILTQMKLFGDVNESR